VQENDVPVHAGAARADDAALTTPSAKFKWTSGWPVATLNRA
jgi:hypothetical protein